MVFYFVAMQRGLENAVVTCRIIVTGYNAQGSQYLFAQDPSRLPKLQQMNLCNVGAVPIFQICKEDKGIRHRSNRKVEQTILINLIEVVLFMAQIEDIYSQSLSRLLWGCYEID